MGYNRGHHGKVEKLCPPKKDLKLEHDVYLQMNIYVWNQGDVEQWNPKPT